MLWFENNVIIVITDFETNMNLDYRLITPTYLTIPKDKLNDKEYILMEFESYCEYDYNGYVEIVITDIEWEVL